MPRLVQKGTLSKVGSSSRAFHYAEGLRDVCRGRTDGGSAALMIDPIKRSPGATIDRRYMGAIHVMRPVPGFAEISAKFAQLGGVNEAPANRWPRAADGSA